MVGFDGRWRTLAALAVLGVVFVAAFVQTVAVAPRSSPRSLRTPSDVKLVAVDSHSDALLWPYTSRHRRFETLTLPVNVVVDGDAARTRAVIVDGARAPRGDDGSHWRLANGATRYSYVHTSSPRTGGWIDETFQLQDGDYFGTRYHVRAYENGADDGTWTALQVHHEHWDWFRLRHTVGSTARGQRYVERQFYGRPAVSSVERRRFANGGILDADGWATVVFLSGGSSPVPSRSPAQSSSPVSSSPQASPSSPQSPLSPVVLVPSLLLAAIVVQVGRRTDERICGLFRRRFGGDGPTPREVGLALVLLGLPTTLRAASIAAERLVPSLSPKPIAATGYLLLAVGLPACVTLASRPIRSAVSAPLAGVCIGVGFLVDYAVLDVTVLPFAVVVHRFALASVLALLAVGGSRWGNEGTPRNRALLVGVPLWVVALLWPLLDRLLALVGL